MDWLTTALSNPLAPIVAFMLGGLFNAGVAEWRERGSEKRRQAHTAAQWAREDRIRRVTRGEAAVREIHEMLDAAYQVFRDYRPESGHWYDGPAQASFETEYYGIRRRAAEVPDETFRNRIDMIVELIYQWRPLLEEEDLTARQTAYKAHQAGRRLVVSWLDSATVPDQPEVVQLHQSIVDHYAEQERIEREWRKAEESGVGGDSGTE